MSAALLLPASPVVAVAAVAIKATSPGPVIFRQTRVGRACRLFQVYKLRTMKADAGDELHRDFVLNLLTNTTDGDAARPAQATEDADVATGTGHRTPFKISVDPRITPVGKVLRRWSIDEIPQLVNVLRGDMSLIGPRPDLPYSVANYEPRHRQRLAVQPGLTGLWQVSGRGMLSPVDMLRLDVEYAERQSLLLDLRILVKTVPAIFQRIGAE